MLLDAGGMEELAERLAAGRRQAALERLAILFGQKAVLEADVEVIPRQPGIDRDGSQIELGRRPALCERTRPSFEVKMLVPAVEARPAYKGQLERVREP